MANIELTAQGILGLDVDVIVNPANSFLRHGAGLAKIIADAAGPAFWAESRATPTISTGDAAITTAGNLPFKAVIHAVGPVYTDGTFQEDYLLTRVHHRCIELAEQIGAKSIAFPAISCGLFRFPVDYAAPLATGAARYPNNLDRIVFSLPDVKNFEAYSKALL